MAANRVDDAETVLLRCERCGHSQQVALADTEGSRILECGGCGASIFWHRCVTCGLQYVGPADAPCAVCDDPELDDLQIL